MQAESRRGDGPLKRFWYDIDVAVGFNKRLLRDLIMALAVNELVSAAEIAEDARGGGPFYGWIVGG